MRIQVDNVRGFHAELIAKTYRYAKPGIEHTPWGTLDVSVKDPFGNRLVFTTAIST